MSHLNLPSPHARPPSSSSFTTTPNDNHDHNNNSKNPPPRSPAALSTPFSANDPNPDPDSDSDSDSDSAPLPFPAALARADFLAPHFDPAAYLSALHTGGPAARHQTLEDLRSELRERSAAISAELLELVNNHYGAFLSLGDELQGGGDRAGDVRVALLGFRRGVEELQGKVRERRVEVGRATGELRGVREAVEVGRRMLELEERVGGLEGRLAVGSIGAGGLRKGASTKGEGEGEDEDDEDWGSEESEDEDEAEEDGEAGEEGLGFVSRSPSKLAALAREYVLVESIADTVGRDLPFVRKMEERLARCRNTILLDLSTALKEARRAGPKGQGRVLQYLAIYRTLDAQADAVRVLKRK